MNRSALACASALTLSPSRPIEAFAKRTASSRLRSSDNFDGYKNLDPVHHQDPERTLAYRMVLDGTSSFVRGLQFLLPAGTAEELGQAEYDADRAPKSYETFLIQDFKNDRVVEWSCDPKSLASYFVPKSPRPFETSPVFFNAQVLDKYKANREKYQIRDRTITCRNSWYLKTYDVNTAGQVHTYVVYLGNLPYAEQQYWKSFNEAPKAPISVRAFKTDFEGSFDTEPDPLRDLIGTLNNLIRKDVPWFRCKAPELIEQIHYPLTSAHAGWDDTVLDLAKIIVEGLDRASLRAIANQHQRQGEPTFASIRWLREALQGLGLEEADAIESVSPLVELQAFRSKMSAHAGGREAATMRRDLLRKYGTPKGHVEDLAGRLDATLHTAMELLSPDKI